MHLFDVLAAYPLLLFLFTAILGLLVGSFLNVVIYRLPVMMEREWKTECRLILELDEPARETRNKPETFNLAHPRSCCPHCQTQIKAWQNIPVISYLILGGKCGHCSKPISCRYPIIEAFTGLLSVIIAWQFGVSFQTLAALLFTWCLISLTMIDADHKLLPDQLTLPLLWLGLLVNSAGLFTSLFDAVWGAIGGYLILWSVYWLFKLLTGKEGMGYGDFKLLAALGAWMGWQSLLTIILMSSLVGAVIGSLILFINNRGRSTTIPFGPYLAAAGWITFLWGEEIFTAYLKIVTP